MVAVVAAQLAAALVHGHPRVAARALADPAAVVAKQGRSEAAAVEEHQYLLAGRQGIADGLLQRTGKAGVERHALHVEADELRRVRATGALGQAQQAVAAGLGVVQAFQGGRGRTEQDRHVLQACAYQCQVAGVVAQAVLLFIGGVVFLVDDDQSRPLQWSEQRRTGADDDVGLAIPGGEPGVEALAVGQGRMQQGDARVEAAFETRQGLRPQVDLGNQHQGLAACGQGFADQLQVDLGLAAAGDPGQQEAMETAVAGANRLEGGALLGVQRQLRLGQPAAFARRGAVAPHLQFDQAFFLEQVEAVLVYLQLVQQLMGHPVRMLLENRQGLALARRPGQARIVEAGLRGGMPEALLARLGRLALAQQVGQRPGQGVAEAVLVVLGGPATEFEQVRRHRRLGVEYPEGRLELVFGYFGTVRHLYQNANQLPAPERQQQANPRL